MKSGRRVTMTRGMPTWPPDALHHLALGLIPALPVTLPAVRSDGGGVTPLYLGEADDGSITGVLPGPPPALGLALTAHVGDGPRSRYELDLRVWSAERIRRTESLVRLVVSGCQPA